MGYVAWGGDKPNVRSSEEHRTFLEGAVISWLTWCAQVYVVRAADRASLQKPCPTRQDGPFQDRTHCSVMAPPSLRCVLPLK
jgi:hypothetical protein